MSIEASYKNSRMAKILPEPGELVTRDVHTLPGLIYEMAEAYPGIGLPHFRPGMYVYGVVTERVIKAADDNELDDPDKMRLNMLTFADQEIQTTHSLIHGDMNGLREWEYMYHRKNPEDIPAAVSMSDFYTIHTGPDLGRVQVLTGTDPELHERDYFKVDDYLREVGRDVLDDIVDMSPFFKQLKIPEISLMFMMNKVIKRRKKVWDGYLKIHAAGDNRVAVNQQIEEELRRDVIKSNLAFDRWVGGAIRRTTRTPERLDERLRSKLALRNTATTPLDASTIQFHPLELSQDSLHPAKPVIE